ncbi:hypothetical protein V6Z11_D04G045700 [Gossypium hirsutum]
MASKNQLHHHFTCLALLIFILGICEATSRAALEDASMYERHQQWMVQFGRVYRDTNERQKRFQIFKQNEMWHASTLSMLPTTSHLTNQEFTASRNGFKSHMCSNTATTFKYENATALPSTVDWRKKGAVTPIKDQGQCGCCWAFSAVAAMEGVTKLTTGKLISLSEQELVDCDTKGEDQGCEGGLMDDAFQFIEKNKGLTTESIYPYKGVDGTCNTNEEANHAAKINGFEDVPANSEDALQKAVANQPVSVAIDAGGFDFQFSSGGVFTGSCGTDLDHGVTAVGYGEDGGTKYWLVKNSWVSSWGEEGYIRMQRDVDAKEGLCGIAMQASYPTA